MAAETPLVPCLPKAPLPSFPLDLTFLEPLDSLRLWEIPAHASLSKQSPAMLVVHCWLSQSYLFPCVCVCVCACACAWSVSHVTLFVTPYTAARQAPLSLGFPKQEYWSGLPFPPPGNLPNPGIKPTSLAPPALAGGFFTSAPPRKPIFSVDRSQTSQTSCKRWKYALSKTRGEVWCHQ